MPITPIWGALLILILCPLLGGLPLIEWISNRLTGRRLSQRGTGNVSVSAAFYHGGRWVGILAVLSEAFKGIAAVLLARYCVPEDPIWEIVALIALVIGRYAWARGAGTTNVVWGFVVHDWVAAALILLISSISFTILRERQQGRLGVLVLLPLISALRHPHDGARIGAIVTLSLLLAWIYQKIPDDLDLSSNSAQDSSQRMFRFFRGDRAVLSLDQPLEVAKVGHKAATLSQLCRWAYPVPEGWVLPPGDDPEPLVQLLQPTAERPLVVRSSAIGEDTAGASAAGQYESILNVTSRAALEQAIVRCQASYNRPGATQYRLDRGSPTGGMAVLVQQQVRGVFSGVAFSRDPISRQGDAVAIEALPGAASAVVSGQVTPEQYRVWIKEADFPDRADWRLPDALKLEVEGAGDVPPRLIQQVAYLVRHLEAHYHGIPQDIEWSYDGQQLWLLQSRPITTLLPIWTRKIAAEVIPGHIHPLTWSINRPLTCGTWGEIFTIVLGERARGLNFEETATLHHASAYFNASLLGEIFCRMGLPAESLEFLTRGAKFSKPPVQSTLRNLPGLLRLWQRERRLEPDFERDQQRYFRPGFAALAQPIAELTPQQLLTRIDQILELLRPATYYSILAPLSLAFRQAVTQVSDRSLDSGQTPEVASLRALQALAITAHASLQLEPDTEPAAVWRRLTDSPEGQSVLRQFEAVLDRYGYLSEVATDIAVPTWKENPQPVREAFIQFLLNPTASPAAAAMPTRKARGVQQRLHLKGRVSEVYSRLLAELRWSFVALEQIWLRQAWITQPGDIFLLTFDEIRSLIAQPQSDLQSRMQPLVADRRSQIEADRRLPVPTLVYGNDPPAVQPDIRPLAPASRQLRGIGASPGRAEGTALVLKTLQSVPDINSNTILVVPYTDSGWAPLLARAGGIVAEAGGRLSHGAIVAREYGIPAVMDIHSATQILRDGQRLRIDGQQGTVELL
jgi:pyruvate,water dikinase